MQARYSWSPPTFNQGLSHAGSSGLLASLKEKVKRIRRTTSGASTGSPHPHSAPQPFPYPPRLAQAPKQSSNDHSQSAAAYIEGIGWSTPAVVSPRVPLPSSSSSPLGRQSSIMPDWTLPGPSPAQTAFTLAV